MSHTYVPTATRSSRLHATYIYESCHTTHLKKISMGRVYLRTATRLSQFHATYECVMSHNKTHIKNISIHLRTASQTTRLHATSMNESCRIITNISNTCYWVMSTCAQGLERLCVGIARAAAGINFSKVSSLQI